MTTVIAVGRGPLLRRPAQRGGEGGDARYQLLEMTDVPDVRYAYAVRSGAPLPVSAQRLLEHIAGKQA